MLFFGGGAYWSLPDAAIWWGLQMWTGCGGVLTRADLQRGMELIYHHFARFGLEMHIGRDMPESKTDCVFFSSTILPTPGADEHCGYHNSTCIPTHHAHSGHIATEETPQDQQASSPTTATNLLSPTSFPIGFWVAVTSSHKNMPTPMAL
jgi:hypothetical protein